MSSDVLNDVLSAPEIAAGVFSDTTPHDIAVSVRGLAKSYSIARNAVQHSTMGDALMAKLRNPLAKAERDTFWALSDVNFDIQKGDVVGIIGRNGAGKSTLLKILSRITEPTKGKIDLYGRVGSLLEVGTGFHPELTGRENVFLNGAILGMQKSEIARQFDAIVEFSGTEKFLDTPVKRYSSGMYVRLAFAVAAHLNPEILIIDEVLAVGDADFQKKCIGKMKDVAESGRTVIFVSHHMQSISLLCNRGIFLSRGEVAYSGDVASTVDEYIRSNLQTSLQGADPSSRQGSGEYRLTSVRPIKDYYSVAEPKSFDFEITRSGTERESVYLSFHVMDSRGSMLAHFDSRVIGFYLDKSPTIHGKFTFKTPWLKPGAYYIDATLFQASTGYVDDLERACDFSVGPIFPYPEPATGEASTKGMVMGDFDVQIENR